MTSQVSRRSAVGRLKRVIEAAHTFVASRFCYLCHWQASLVDEPLGKLQSLGVRDGQRARSQVRLEQAPQMAARHTEAICQLFNVARIERAVRDEPQPATNRG